jgi:hypothetical protein
MNKFIYSLLTVVLCAVFFSCSSSEAKVLSVTGTTIFEYEDEKSNPSLRFSVFLHIENEAQRTESIKIVHRNTKYTWYVTDPVIFTNSNKNYAGYSNLKSPGPDAVLTGSYDVFYSDAAGNEAKSSFSISYKKELLDSPCTEIKNITKGILAENTILYDKNMNMLYYGAKKSTWKADVNIMRDYNKAAYIRTCLATTSGSQLYLLPLTKLGQTDKKPDGESENE